MKFFLTIFAIAVVAAQSTMAVPVEPTPTELLSIAKEIIAYSGKVAADVLKEIPDTDKYSAYRVDLDVYIDIADKVAASDCGVVTLKGLENLYLVFAKYNGDSIERNDEYFEVEKLFKKHGGDKLEEDAHDFKNAYINDHFKEGVLNYVKTQEGCVELLL